MTHQPLPTDLLLNADGSAYHLAIPFGILPDRVITVGDPERVAFFRPYFDSIEFKMQKREFHSLIGSIKGTPVAVISTGIGTDNIDIVLNELDVLANYNPATNTFGSARSLSITRIGTSGSLREEIETGSILQSMWATAFDNLLAYYQFDNTAEIFANHSLAGQFSLQTVPVSIQGGRSEAASFATAGHTATCPGFYGPQGRRLRLPLHFDLLASLAASDATPLPPFTNFEMETAGIFGLSRLLGHQATSFSLIVANRQTGKYLNPSEPAMQQCIERVVEYVLA